MHFYSSRVSIWDKIKEEIKVSKRKICEKNIISAGAMALGLSIIPMTAAFADDSENIAKKLANPIMNRWIFLVYVDWLNDYLPVWLAPVTLPYKLTNI